MAVTIVNGNFYVTNGTVSGNTIDVPTSNGDLTVVVIHSTKISYDYENKMNLIPILLSRGSRSYSTSDLDNLGDATTTDSSKKSYSRNIDLKRIMEQISVTGFLEDESTERAITKRKNLRALARNFGALTVVWGTGNYQTIWTPNVAPYGAFITKIHTDEIVGKIGEADFQDKAVNITSISGNATTLTVVASGHGLSAGNTFYVYNTTNYDGAYVVATVNGSTITASTISHNFASESSGTLWTTNAPETAISISLSVVRGKDI